jgi:hypothetical protein
MEPTRFSVRPTIRATPNSLCMKYGVLAVEILVYRHNLHFVSIYGPKWWRCLLFAGHLGVRYISITIRSQRWLLRLPRKKKSQQQQGLFSLCLFLFLADSCSSTLFLLIRVSCSCAKSSAVKCRFCNHKTILLVGNSCQCVYSYIFSNLLPQSFSTPRYCRLFQPSSDLDRTAQNHRHSALLLPSLWLPHSCIFPSLFRLSFAPSYQLCGEASVPF